MSRPVFWLIELRAINTLLVKPVTRNTDAIEDSDHIRIVAKRAADHVAHTNEADTGCDVASRQIAGLVRANLVAQNYRAGGIRIAHDDWEHADAKPEVARQHVPASSELPPIVTLWPATVMAL